MKQRMWLAAVLGMLIPSWALGQVKEVRVTMEGLACPFCVFNVEKQIKRVPGIEPASVRTDLDKGVTTAAWKPDVPFDPALLKKAVKDSGFTLKSIEITAEGKVRRVDRSAPRLELVVPAGKVPITLGRAERADRRRSWERLAEAAEAEGATARVWGEVIEAGDSGWSLVLHGWGPVEHGAQVDFAVNDLACEQCSLRLVQRLESAPGILHAEADHERDLVQVWVESDRPDVDALRRQIEEAGFTVLHAHVAGEPPEPGSAR